jgi:hypothetical protein
MVMLTINTSMRGPQKSISNNGPSLHSVAGPIFLDNTVNAVQVRARVFVNFNEIFYSIRLSLITYNKCCPVIPQQAFDD